MNDQTLGIVCNTIDYKDNDAIISCFSKDYGKLSFYVKGYKKITSKNVYATQLFDVSEFLFDYNPSKQIQVLKTASLKDEHLKIKQDYEKLSIASTIVELSMLTLENDDYEFLNQSLQLIDNTQQPITVFNVFLAMLLEKCGINPQVDNCCLCGNTNGIESISIEDGGFVCGNCNKQVHQSNYDNEMLKKFRIINKANYDVIEKLYPLNFNDFNLSQLLMSFVDFYLDIKLKSYKNLLNIYK